MCSHPRYLPIGLDFRLILLRNPPPPAGYCRIVLMSRLPAVVGCILQMAQQEEPLYDFPEPSQPPGQRFVPHHRGRGSLKSISVLDRLLLTVPVWFQLSINPATALHILQREPPGVRATYTQLQVAHTRLLSSAGAFSHRLTNALCDPQTFLVRKSRTSQRNVLCVRLADDSVPSFVQQFGIREEQSSENALLCQTSHTQQLVTGF